MTTTTTNEQRSAAEVAAFLAEQPASYFAYHGGGIFRPRGERWGTGRAITTWTGEPLAKVIDVGDTYRSNFGDLRQAFRARTVSGVLYSGIAFLSAGDYVRMRKVKG